MYKKWDHIVFHWEMIEVKIAGVLPSLAIISPTSPFTHTSLSFVRTYGTCMYSHAGGAEESLQGSHHSRRELLLWSPGAKRTRDCWPLWHWREWESKRVRFGWTKFDQNEWATTLILGIESALLITKACRLGFLFSLQLLLPSHLRFNYIVLQFVGDDDIHSSLFMSLSFPQ